MQTYLAVRKLLKIIPVEGTYHNVSGDTYISQPLHAVPLHVESPGYITDKSLKNWQARIIEDEEDTKVQQRIVGVRYREEQSENKLTIPLPSIGINSGCRSAIVQNVHIQPFIGFGFSEAGSLYKIKGCRLASQQYLLSAADIVEPEGAQSAEQAQLECERTIHINDL